MQALQHFTFRHIIDDIRVDIISVRVEVFKVQTQHNIASELK